jgi:hypothetical protein
MSLREMVELGSITNLVYWSSTATGMSADPLSNGRATLVDRRLSLSLSVT